MGTLYLVATPIGNLEDITLRALRVLREASLVAAEDTRHTRQLLSHFEITTPLTSYFEHNKLSKLDNILGALSDGDVALVSDAGTPGISDPGYELVRAAIEAGRLVVPIPGPSAIVAAVAASGLPTDGFVFLGFLPRKSGERRSLFREVLAERRTLVCYEAPHRVLEALEDMAAELGDRPIAVARELTKLHEEFWRGTLRGAIRRFEETAPRGEFTLVVGGASAGSVWSEGRVIEALQESREAGLSASSAAARIATESGWARRDVYRLATRRDPLSDAESSHSEESS